MASLTGTLTEGGRDEPSRAVVLRVTAGGRDAALGVLLTGRVAGSGAPVEQFLDFVRQQRLSIEHLWAAYEGSDPVAAVLLVPCAGRTSMAFVSPLVAPARVGVLGRVARAAVAGQDAAQVRLVQALLDPGQDLEQQALTEAGFTGLATLIYMQHAGERDAPAFEPPKGVRVIGWSEAERGRFCEAIAASYEETLDCPGLLGVRPIEDVLTGHMGAGRFSPELWCLLWSDGTHGQAGPVGVMLLNGVPPRQALELVYLGLSPAWRGRGLGKALLRHALRLTHAHGAANLVLAVDEANAPAVTLYRGMRFAATGRKRAMIATLA